MWQHAQTLNLRGLGYVTVGYFEVSNSQTASGGLRDHCISNFSCVSVRPSVTGGQRKRFDLETQDAVSLAVELQKVEMGSLYERQSRL